MSTRAHPGHFAARPHTIEGELGPRAAAGHRPARIFRFCASVLGILLLFAFSLVGGALLHLDVARARKVVTREVNAILAPSFRGRIEIEHLGALGLFGLSRTDVTIAGPTHRPVVVARGVRVRLAKLAAAYSAVVGKRQPLTIRLTDVSIDEAEVRLDTNAQGHLDLLDAVASAKPSPPADENARGFKLIVSRLVLRHVRARGQMAGAPPIDVDLRDFTGALSYAPDALEGDVFGTTIVAHRLASGSDVRGDLSAHVTAPSAPHPKIVARLAWNGTVGPIAHSIRAALVRDQVDAIVDVPDTRAADLRAILPDLPVDRPASAHLEAHGVLPNIDASLHAQLGGATLDARAGASVGDEKRADVSFESNGIDVRQFAKSAPPSRLALSGRAAAVWKADGTLTGNLLLRLLGGRLGDDDLPEATVTATLAGSSPSALRARLDAVVHEPAAPTTLDVSVFPVGASSGIDFDLRSDSADLSRLRELRQAVTGSAHLRAKGHLDLARRVVDAKVAAEAQNVSRGSMRLDAASLDVRAAGDVAAPRIDAAIRFRGIVINERRLTTAVATAVGAATSPHITASLRSPDIPDVDAAADLDLRRGVSLQAPHISLEHAGEHALLRARDARIEGSDVRIDGARLEGLGAPLSADLAVTRGAMRLRASTDGLDLGRIARLAQLEKHLRAGTLAIDGKLDVRRSQATGAATLSVAGASIGNARGVAATVHVEAAGRRFTGKIHAEATGIGSLDIDAPKIDVSGSTPLLSTSWREASGSVGIDVRGDLAKAVTLVPPEDLPLSEARGDVVLRARMARDDVHDQTPYVALSLTTDHLALAPKGSQTRNIDGVLVIAPPSWRLEGVDFVVDGNVDGSSGAISLVTRARDANGDLAQLKFESPKFSYDDVFGNPGRLAEDIRRTPFDLSLVVPERGLGRVPDLFKQHYVSGRIQANATVKGTLLAPDVAIAATLKDSRFSSDAQSHNRPLDFDIAARYDGRHATASIKATSDGATALDATGDLDATAAQFVEGVPSPAWRASATVHFDRFPLEAITTVGDKLVSGALSGEISLADLHEDAHARAALSVDALKVGSFTYKSARLDATADGHALDAKVRVDQVDGFAETNAHGMAGWGAALAPTLDPTRPLDVTLMSKNFRIAVLLPLVEGTLDELDGRIDSDARLQLDPGTRGARLSGSLELSRGALEAVAGGGELHEIAANVRFAPDGTATVEKLTAAGLTGRLEASATAHLDGLSLRSAEGVIVIPSKSAILLSAGGAEIGNVDGRIEVRETTADAGRTMNVNVSVPHLRVALPEGSTTTASTLGPMDRVKIGAHRGETQTFVIIPLDPPYESQRAPAGPSSTRIAIVTHLADVQVVKGTELNVELTGQVNVSSGATTDVTGQIRLKRGGTLVVQGKKFTVEDGTVTLTGADPSNPQVVVKAGWTAPDGTIVYANFMGPLKTGKVTLQSEPALPKEEIVSLLLYGTADGPQKQAPQANTENTAIATVGGQAAQPLNHMLNQLGLGTISANVDTSQSSNPKPEVEVQIARDISLQIAYVLGNPPPGVNPDRTLLTLNYRFLSRWSLASTVGDAGTTILDLLWKKRY